MRTVALPRSPGSQRNCLSLHIDTKCGAMGHLHDHEGPGLANTYLGLRESSPRQASPYKFALATLDGAGNRRCDFSAPCLQGDGGEEGDDDRDEKEERRHNEDDFGDCAPPGTTQGGHDQKRAASARLKSSAIKLANESEESTL